MFLKKPTGLLHTTRTTRDKELRQYSTTQSPSNKLGTTELEILTHYDPLLKVKHLRGSLGIPLDYSVQ